MKTPEEIIPNLLCISTFWWWTLNSAWWLIRKRVSFFLYQNQTWQSQIEKYSSVLRWVLTRKHMVCPDSWPLTVCPTLISQWNIGLDTHPVVDCLHNYGFLTTQSIWPTGQMDRFSQPWLPLSWCRPGGNQWFNHFLNFLPTKMFPDESLYWLQLWTTCGLYSTV